ncbi:fructokinase [Azospirillum sp. RWY-5-1]|uniref:Fructokinase n=1 Tax=Azospirillum oleiclasticum TaxID=2735135 RepID=A0ABX2TE44_9PROT|nr:PfkB family carbohydrate kinase [Azospirillum oleiclasticum]NYZ15567.1 fructokinase [Azospirillum oleiclasticum]NYZ22590.1 fructokinase [Azospirillum oleiclasticum]
MTSRQSGGDAFDALCMGEVLIDFMPIRPGAPAGGIGAFTPAAGGAPANVAAGLARLGVRSAFLGRTGADGFGRFLAGALAGCGVDVGRLRLVPGARTPVAFVSLDNAGEREFLFYGEPMTGFGPGDLDLPAVEGSRLLHVGSIGLIDPSAREATLLAVEAARRHGRIVSFDANLRPALWPDLETARRMIRRAAGLATVVKLSDEELVFVTGSAVPDDGGRSLWHDDLRLLVVTHGRNGCTFLTRDACEHVPGVAVPTVDTTGAGDAFMAALLAGMLETPDFSCTAERVRPVCRFANAAGALSTTAAGAIPALPDRDAVLRLLGDG